MENVLFRLEVGPSAWERNLAFVASAAAVELDNARRAAEVEWDVVARLRELLCSALPQETHHTTTARALMDPVTATLFSRAFGTSRGIRVETAAQLKTLTEDVTERLERVVDSASQEEVEELRDFCIALSQSAQGTLGTGHEERNRNRHRR